MRCEVQAAGTIELYFYGELPFAERGAVQTHLSGCVECRQALEDLSVIRTALAGRPDVATPPGGDWSGFMSRLNAAVAAEPSRTAPESVPGAGVPPRRRLAPYLAIAATLALVAAGAVAVLQQREAARRTAGEVLSGTDRENPSRTAREGPTRAASEPQPAPASGLVSDVRPAVLQSEPDPALVAVSGQHFERSKLVVLGLTTKDGRQDDWAFERELASTLLSDTRLYRQAAEERGMQPLAEVMGDLELVLLQASMTDEATEASLHQLQRLIQRRDLITKMDAY